MLRPILSIHIFCGRDIFEPFKRLCYHIDIGLFTINDVYIIFRIDLISHKLISNRINITGDVPTDLERDF